MKTFGEREHPFEHTVGVIEPGDVERANAVTNEPAMHPPADSLATGTPHAQGSAVPRRTRPRNPAPQPAAVPAAAAVAAPAAVDASLPATLVGETPRAARARARAAALKGEPDGLAGKS